MANPPEEKGSIDTAAEQLNSMSIGDGKAGSDVDARNAAKSNFGGCGNGHTAAGSSALPTMLPERFCSACGKIGIANQDLKQCSGCKCVWYCGAICQRAHWKAHKKECKLIGLVVKERAKGGRTEVSPSHKPDFGDDVERDGDAALFVQPTRDDCDICMRVLPIETSLRTYMTCCGKVVCFGCSFECTRATEAMNEKKAKKNQNLLLDMCAFCRQPTADSSEITIRRTNERVERGDSHGMKQLALFYLEGEYGLPKDDAKALDLMRQSAELGEIDAKYALAVFSMTGDLGLEIDEAKSIIYFEQAAKGGNVLARFNLGQKEFRNRNFKRAIRHWRIAAAAGYDEAVMRLMSCFEEGVITLEELAGYIQARDKAAIEINSDDRNRAKKIAMSMGAY